MKQASRQWHKCFDDHVLKCGFDKSLYDECVYIKRKNGVPVAYLLLYVHDMLLAGSCKSELQAVKDDLMVVFDMKDLGPAKRILGMNIIKDRPRKLIWLSQHDYVARLLQRFKMDNVKETQHHWLNTSSYPKIKGQSQKLRLRCREFPMPTSLEGLCML